MPVIRVNATEDSAALHSGTGSVAGALAGCQAKDDAIDGPVIVMIHGYKYHPHHPLNCPHDHVLALHPRARRGIAHGWPRHLGFGTGRADEGLAIAFGWQARGALRHAQQRAALAGQALARILADQKRIAPQRRVHVIAHSLGIEVALEALHHLPEGSIDRIIAMTGACFLSRARAALETAAGRSAEFINVTSRENDAFDFLFERLIAPPRPGDRAIGHGLDAGNALTLQLDCPGTLQHLRRIGVPVAAPQRRICHWSAYTRPGVLRFYNDLMRRPQALPLELIRSGLPQTPARRWSRLFAAPALPLPFVQRAT